MGLEIDDLPNQALPRILTELPEGVVAPSRWLNDHGVSPQLAYKYVAHGWLASLGHGAFARPTQPITWTGVVLGLQRLAGLPVHVGGVSALNLHGLAHYLPLGGEPHIHLWSHAAKPVHLPAWTQTIHLAQELVLHTRQLFDPAVQAEGFVGLPTRVRDWALITSAPERAILEVLSLVDQTPASFTHAAELFDGLPPLRPALVQRLLENCRSIRTKRVFLFLANRQDTPWYRKVDTNRISLGSGKRLVTRGGRLDKRFQITVPEEFSDRRG